MKLQKILTKTFFIWLGITNIAFANNQLKVLPPEIDGVKPNEMMNRYLLRQVEQKFEQWHGEFERRIGDWGLDYTNWRKIPAQITDYQKLLRTKFIEAIGGLPDRTPLNPKITGIVKRNGYRVEKIIFESQPKFYVTGLLFLPENEKYKPPYPGVLIPCGHSRNGKAKPDYQEVAAQLAINGMAGFVFDPIDQGERAQIFDSNGSVGLLIGAGHSMIGVGSILLGRNTAWFRIWDGMRAIDYMLSRSEIDGNRIGCMGNSGGGTMTAYLMALDDHIIAAAPTCYITTLAKHLVIEGPHDAEQNIFGQLDFGMDQADYLMMRAPIATLVCAETRDFFDIEGTWSSFRCAKRLYSKMGFSERINIIENADSHGWRPPLREAAVRWMQRWLLNKDGDIIVQPIKHLTDEELQCTPTGQVMHIPGAKSTYDLNREFEKHLAKKRKQLWSTSTQNQMLDKVRKIAKIRPLKCLPEPRTEELDVLDKNSYKIRKMIFKPQHGIYLPALLFLPNNPAAEKPVLYLNEKGKSVDVESDAIVEKMVIQGKVVFTVDIRGTGETKSLGRGGRGDVKLAYLLGRSFVGMRAEDILLCARWLSQNNPAKQSTVDLVAIGNIAVPALHAAALESKLFNSVKLQKMLASWTKVLESDWSKNQLVNVVHAALTTYDLENLADVAAAKLTIEQPLDSLEKPINNK